jgi:predicted nucleic acid-binding protein
MNLLDTGIIIDMLKENKYKPGAISPLTLIEVLRAIDGKKRKKVKHLLEDSFAVLNIDNSTIETYCEIYNELKKEGNQLPDADLLIASTAISHQLPLETKDKHFQRLEKFKLKISGI